MDSARISSNRRTRLYVVGVLPNSLPAGRTRAVRAGRHDLARLGVHAPPIDLSTTYPLGSLDEDVAALDRWSAGENHAGNPIYGRVFNPTVDRFEQAVAELEGATSAVAFSSGMAALTAALMVLCRERREVLAIRPLYGTSDHLLQSGPLGLQVTWVNVDDVRSAISDATAAVVIETPQNPTLSLLDISQIVEDSDPIPVLVDNTFATPTLQRPLECGAALVLHSATKFLGGHGDAFGGVIATSEQWAKPLRQTRFATGALLHPFAAYLLHRGIPTLPIRVHAAQATASYLATRLTQHHSVRRVRYPSLDPLASKLIPAQMAGPGSLLAIELADEAAARRFVSGLRLALHAVSLGAFDTLVEHPASMTHRIVDLSDQTAAGVTPGLVRISVGLEDEEDLWQDLCRALHESEPTP